MILKALYDYYSRCEDLARQGTEFKEIGYLIVINQDGQFVRIDSEMIDKKRAKQYLVVQTIKRSGTKYIANFLWDNCDYVLGYSVDKPEKAMQCQKKFVERIEELLNELPDNVYLKSISKFYDSFESNFQNLQQDGLWSELVKSNKNISFLLDGYTNIAAVDAEVLDKVLASESSEDGSICLVSGKRGVTARLHSNIPLQGNAFTSLVSFQKKQGYDSYGKEQAYNAPVSEEAEFKYTTALNKLLAFDSHNKFNIANRTFVFWASSNDEASLEAEEGLYALFGMTSNDDDPNRRIESVRKVFKDIFSGIKPTSDEDRFYFLGLAPNSARIAVVYWNECKLKDFASIILRHFDNMEIVDTRAQEKKKPYQGLHQIMGAVTLGGKSSDVQPNLPDATIKSILQGIPYPASLYQSCIRRIRAEQDVTPYGSPCRMAILKAYLNRLNSNNKNIEVMLDKQNDNTGYLCGRLFATLEKIQENANHIHSIRERYMNAASSTPSSVFATILNLSVHHLEKMTKGQQIYFEKIKQEIIDKLPASGFPAHLDLNDQGRFFIGYYQQRQDFFTSKDAKDAGVENTEE